MVDFDKLNRATREHNNRNCAAPSQRTATMRGTDRQYNQYWQSSYNNENYHRNNGIYSNYYSNK